GTGRTTRPTAGMTPGSVVCGCFPLPRMACIPACSMTRWKTTWTQSSSRLRMPRRCRLNRPDFRSVLQVRMEHHEQEVFAGDARAGAQDARGDATVAPHDDERGPARGGAAGDEPGDVA